MARSEIAKNRCMCGAASWERRSWNSRNLSQYADVQVSSHCLPRQEVSGMGFGLRSAIVALALTSASLVSSPGWAGDDGDAPLWKGIGSIFAPAVGFTGLGGGEKPPPIEYREHGKIVLPPNTELPPPGSSASADPCLARESGDHAQESAKGRGKEINRRGGRCASALHAWVPGERARDHSSGGSRWANGEVRKQLRADLIGARQP